LARSGRREPKNSPAPRRLSVRIETIGSGGDGVARLDGDIIYTPLTAPGDLALIDATGDRGRLIELAEKSPLRAIPPCRHFGQCGGCALQHITREEELRWKHQLVATALTRAGVETEVRAVIAAPAASRRRATFSVRRAGETLLIGFNERRSTRMTNLEECVVLAPALSAQLEALNDIAALIPSPEFDLAVTHCDNGLDLNAIDRRLKARGVTEAPGLAAAMRAAGAVRLSVNSEIALALAEPTVTFDGVTVNPPPGAFLQASREGEAALLGIVRAAVGDARKIADLFSGCGTIALPLAHAASVFAVDSDAQAIDALRRAAAAAQRAGVQINPVRAETRDLFERPLSAKELKNLDAVIFDPPRAGAAAQAAEIAKSGVPIVAGVSCNPATFARDASLLVAGGYGLVEVTPVDQFVYSQHVELVGVFAKR
jgi:23S rRNA (uracil1939-C5)-methyltransferase